MREALNGRPAAERTRREYQRVIAAYRRVYYGAPTSTKADPSVVAVAELLVEMGRRFENDDILRSAIGQYEFLRREYPGSKYRFEALFTIGEIYQDDLNDAAHARAVFGEFLRRYPRHDLAEEARKALSDPAQQAVAKSRENDSDGDKEGPPKETPASESAPAAETRNAKVPRVTGIRHWSTPDYTRVAIDLEQDVRYEAQRIDHPDRIFFDLLDAKLASTLVGKTFDVDDGFLKRIRAAQFQPGRTRVVLEVDDISDYNAFLLSNPSRLIIDIHGKPQGKGPTADSSKRVAGTESAPSTQSPKAASSEGPKKKIVEADDDDAAKVEGAKIKPASKTTVGTTLGPAEISPSLQSKSRGAKSRRKSNLGEPDAHEARPTSGGDRSLIRALGLKIGRIVIDPGHGGHDTGTIGPNGLEEKDLVLEVARRLGRTLRARVHFGRGGARGRESGVVPSPEALARIRPDETTYEDVLTICGGSPEEETRLPSGEARTLIYRGQRVVPHGWRSFGWFGTVRRWEVEHHEVQIDLDHGRVRDIQARVRRSRLGDLPPPSGR